MKALLTKDRPWLAMFLTGGAVSMIAATCCHSFADEFVVPRSDRQALFHLAWSLGLALGVVAGCFDELLGTREYLTQRAVRSGDLVRARLAGCGLVLASWFVLVPVGAYSVFWCFDPDWEMGHWQQVPELLGTMVPAVSACALGLAAAALPLHWFGRLCVLAVEFGLSFSAVFWLERERPSMDTSWPAFVSGHAAVAAVGVFWAWLVRDLQRDLDRPVPALARRRVVVPVLALLTCCGCFGLTAFAANAVARLRNTYPRVVEDRGTMVLATRPEWGQPWEVVDAQHQPTGQRLPEAKQPGDGRPGRGLSLDFVRIEAPRSGGYVSAAGTGEGRLRVGSDGAAWWQSHTGGLRRLARSADATDFAPGTKVGVLERRQGEPPVAALLEPAGNGVFLFDSSTTSFQWLPVPEGDRLLSFAHHGHDQLELLPNGSALAPGERLVEGEQFGYVVRDAKLLPVVRRKARAAPDAEASARVRVVDVDVLGFTLVIDGRDGGPAFTHRFEPRTFKERSLAALATAFSALRPPLLQTIATGLPEPLEQRAHAKWQWLCDPLVAGGRRWWLVGVAWLLAAVSARWVRRRLRRFGAGAEAVRFWTIATVLLGPVGAYACFLCELPRRHARRTAAPAAAPRLFTAPTEKESVA